MITRPELWTSTTRNSLVHWTSEVQNFFLTLPVFTLKKPQTIPCSGKMRTMYQTSGEGGGGVPLILPDWEWTAEQGMVLGVLKPVLLLTLKSQE